MGMAYRPPANGREGKFYISEHAIGRLRERAKVLVQYGNSDLIGLINEATEKSVDAKKPADIIDSKGEPSQLADLTGHLDNMLAVGEVWALIKQPKGEERRPAVVTIVDGDTARRMLSKGRAEDADLPPFNPAFAGLKDVKIPNGNGNGKPAPIDRAVPGDSPQYLVMGSGNEVFKVGNRQEVVEFVAADESNRDLRIFKECKFRMKVVTTVEMED